MWAAIRRWFAGRRAPGSALLRELSGQDVVAIGISREDRVELRLHPSGDTLSLWVVPGQHRGHLHAELLDAEKNRICTEGTSRSVDESS